MPSDDSLYLLRNVLTAPRLMYLCKTAPCKGIPELPKLDAVLRKSVSTTLNIDLGDDRWTQASLLIRGQSGHPQCRFAGTFRLLGISYEH